MGERDSLRRALLEQKVGGRQAHLGGEGLPTEGPARTEGRRETGSLRGRGTPYGGPC